MAASSTTKDKSITKISAFTAPKGKLGQKYLASGKTLSMRIWENEKAGEKESTAREYGTAKLILEGQTIDIEPGDSWVIPKGAEHKFIVLESLTAIEATSPPAFVGGRDEPLNVESRQNA